MSKSLEASTALPLAEAFRFCPRCSAENATVGDNPFACPQCGFRFYFSPVCGVVCLIANPAGEVILLERQNDPGKGLYGLPGGFVDPGESASDAAVREVREEIGLSVVKLKYIGSFPNHYLYRGIVIPVVDVIYECDVASFDSLTHDAGEVRRLHICHPGPHELGRMAFESNRRGLELFLASRT